MDSRAVRRLPAYVYLQELLRGRRVLELGAGEGHSAHFLLRAGAKNVLGIEPNVRLADAARARYRVTGLEIRGGDYGALELEDGSFDAVCAPAAAELLRRRGVIEEIKRVLAPGGVALFACPSADRPDARAGLSYHELTERLSASFDPVRMVGVSPFVGFSMVEFGDEATELTEIDLDTQLAQIDAPGGEAGVITDYVALCNAPTEKPRGYTVVQLPVGLGITAAADAQGVAGPAVATATGATDLAGEDLRRRLARVTDERAALLAEVASLRARANETETELGQVTALAAKEVGQARAESAAARATAQESQEQMTALRREMLALRGELDAHSAMGALGRAGSGGVPRQPPAEQVTGDQGGAAEVAKARLELEELRAELTMLRAQQAQTCSTADGEALGDARAELTRGEVVRLNAQLDALRAVVDDATAKAEHGLGEAQRAQAELVRLESALAVARREQQRTEAELDALRREHARAQAAPPVAAASAGAEASGDPVADPPALWDAALRYEQAIQSLRSELEERDAYIEELRDEQAGADEAVRALAHRAQGAEEAARESAAELRGLRSRLALAEGAALRHRLSQENGAAASAAAPSAAASASASPSPAPVRPTPPPTRPPVVVSAPAVDHARVAELEAQIRSQSGATQAAAERLKSVEAKHDDLVRKLRDAERALADERAARSARPSTPPPAAPSPDLARKLADAEAKLAKALAERDELAKSTADLRGRLDQMWKDRDTAIAAAQGESEAVRRERDATVAAVRGELELMHAGAARKKAQVDRLEARVAELERALAAAKKA